MKEKYDNGCQCTVFKSANLECNEIMKIMIVLTLIEPSLKSDESGLKVLEVLKP